MIVFAVSGEKNRRLRDRMETLGIHEKDIEEKFIRSSGKGGQHVNKTSTCVYLRHIPTGIEVKCMEDRSQSVNRFLARRELAERIERLASGKSGGDAGRERKRKQKAKSRKRARAKYSHPQKTGDSGQ